MPKYQDPQMEELIDKATKDFHRKGDLASEQETRLAIAGYIVRSLWAIQENSHHSNSSGPKELVIRLGPPAAVGAGIMSALLAVLEKVFGG